MSNRIDPDWDKWSENLSLGISLRSLLGLWDFFFRVSLETLHGTCYNVILLHFIIINKIAINGFNKKKITKALALL